MSGQIHIRRALSADLSNIVRIESESFPDPWDIETFKETLTYFPSTIFVAVLDRDVVGFIVGGLEDTGEEIYGHICNLAVSPAWRRRAIGRMLVKRAEHQFAVELASGVQLEVRISNRRAREFYEKIGYRQVFCIAGYYANGEDAAVMMKWFRF